VINEVGEGRGITVIEADNVPLAEGVWAETKYINNEARSSLIFTILYF